MSQKQQQHQMFSNQQQTSRRISFEEIEKLVAEQRGMHIKMNGKTYFLARIEDTPLSVLKDSLKAQAEYGIKQQQYSKKK